MANNLYVRDSGALKVLREFRMTITGGIHEEQGEVMHDDGPLNVVDVAAINEFGEGNIPARMWLRGWVSKHTKRVVADIRHAMQYMARTQDYEPEQFEFITEDVMNSLKANILDGHITPANAASTLAKKSPETRPLVEHGQMADAIQGRLVATSPTGGINWKYEAQ